MRYAGPLAALGVFSEPDLSIALCLNVEMELFAHCLETRVVPGNATFPRKSGPLGHRAQPISVPARAC